MNLVNPIVLVACQECGDEFNVYPGEQQVRCPNCLALHNVVRQADGVHLDLVEEERDYDDREVEAAQCGKVIGDIKWFESDRMLGITVDGTTLYTKFSFSGWKWGIEKNNALWINFGPITFVTYLGV